MALNDETVRQVARLANLALSDVEVTAMQRDLGVILQHVTQLQELDTTGVEPTTWVALAAVGLRPDVIEAGLEQAVALEASPQTEGGGFAVPVFVEES